ncbi:cytochrome P450 [Didymella exigua CBS 183.55]|uniref:Cytochrome P450 n=1 Tax=Didymella exigua CBS 183.55 TaxID=1150837 RepID=A0A6A5S5G9_9PLEO|nr:cytochrome P450 [Didymella exigua CBS 183.55]KAF1933736.1 cytochrome P450 [Didymella exigua CBS 183.55]
MGSLFGVPAIIAPAAAFLLWIFWKVFLKPSILPDLPIVGLDRSQWFAWPRTLYKSFHGFRELYGEAYEKYLSQGKPCILPELNDTQVVLPSSLGQWLVDQPDAVLSSQMRQNELLQSKHTFPIPKMAEKPHHAHVIKTDLTRKLGSLSEEIWTELKTALDEHWGTNSEEWREVNVFQTIMRVVTRTSNRLFVGEHLCANEAYLDLCMAFAQDVPIGGILIRLMPSILHPLLAPIITLPNRYHNYKIRQMLRPEILRRLQIAERSTDDAPNDFLQWYITYARKSLEPEESTPKFLSDRIATINFAAIHTSTFTAVNTIYDIVSSPGMNMILSEIKTEVQSVMPPGDERWSKSSVQSMIKTDAVLRESMRYSSFMTGALQRTVVATEGITTPDGLHIKRGNVIGVPALPVHRDPNTYHNPNSFDPLRFLRRTGKDSQQQNNKESTVRSTNTVDTSLIFLPFGHGRHGCPGRFFAANEIKLLLAYIAMNYDIEPLRIRPEPIAFGSIMTPSPNISIKIRRKKE